MTQLYIDKQEVVLPKSMSVAIKRENSFFTKNGEYSYDITINLDNPTNKKIYGFLHRLNHKADMPSKRTALLMADGHIYCSGTEVITGSTESTVTIQIVSGNSELNYFIGQDLMISYLTGMGEVNKDTLVSATAITGDLNRSVVYPDIDYCLPMTYNTTKGRAMNEYEFGDKAPVMISTPADIRVQPYVCAIIKRIVQALGYKLELNQLEDTPYKYAYIVNFINTLKYCEMFPGWSVKDLLEQFENWFNIVFVVDNISRTCKVYVKTSYYLNTVQREIKNVVDEYEMEVNDDTETEHSNSNIKYTLPDTAYYKISHFCDKVKAAMKIKAYDSIDNLYKDVQAATGTAKVMFKDNSTNRTYIKYPANSASDWNRPGMAECDQWRDLIRDSGNENAIEISIVPAPFEYYLVAHHGMNTDIYQNRVMLVSIADDTDVDDETASAADTTATGEQSLTDYLTNIDDSKDSSTSKIQLYAALYNGWHIFSQGRLPTSYTDAYHAINIEGFTIQGGVFWGDVDQFEGSLRLEDIDKSLYGGVYTIDKTHGITINSCDPNMFDVHTVFIINNKRYVCNYIEETLTADGRKMQWKGEFYPITLTDTAAAKKWILADGVWDDGGVWLDDAKWTE